MKKFVFVSDFDGTLTEKDFYQMIIEDRLGEMGKALFDAWKRKEYKGFIWSFIGPDNK